MSCPTSRTYPLRQPKNYRPPVPRWQLSLPKDISQVHTLYAGLQQHQRSAEAATALDTLRASLHSWITDAKPAANEKFIVETGDDVHGSEVWVLYWTDSSAFKNALDSLDLSKRYNSLPPDQKELVGIWAEHFITPIERLETNYSGLDYLPGLASMDIKGIETPEHTYSAYWGAARDRIPSSAHDLFEEAAKPTTSSPDPKPKVLGQHLIGSNYENMVHIRSGQFWENCNEEERDAYESVLEPALRTGLDYLWQNREFTGMLGLRLLRNQNQNEEKAAKREKARETCGAGFFRNLKGLEQWAEKHPSHKAIYLGAIKHAKTFGEDRKFRTWHEVSVLKEGEGRFEYINCQPGSGVTGDVKLEVMDL